MVDGLRSGQYGATALPARQSSREQPLLPTDTLEVDRNEGLQPETWDEQFGVGSLAKAEEVRDPERVSSLHVDRVVGQAPG